MTPLTATAMTAALMQQVSNMKKLEGYYQKSMNSVVKGLRENASKLEVQLFNTDAFIVTVGDRVSRILRVDKAGEKLATTAFRLIFMIRAGIPSEKVHSLVNAYLKDAPVLRQTVLAGIRRSGHCCKVSDEAAFCLIQRPYISKTLLTERISPGDHHNKMLRLGLCVVHASPQYL